MPIRGEIRIVHFLPGRVRLRVAALKGRPQLAQEIQATFDGLPGLTGITTNTTTGSVLITYDPHRILVFKLHGISRFQSIRFDSHRHAGHTPFSMLWRQTRRRPPPEGSRRALRLPSGRFSCQRLKKSEFTERTIHNFGGG